MIARDLAVELKQSAAIYPVVAVLGPRQSGKTTLSRKTFGAYKYLSLEELDIAEHAKNDPRGFLRVYQNEFGIILDEFQNVPTLLSYIQSYVDEHQRPGYFILTGSQNFLMNQAITQTLAGRIAILTLLPLTAQELEAAALLPDLPEEALLRGFYAPVHTRKIRQTAIENLAVDSDDGPVVPAPTLEKWYLNYIKTYVERDIRSITEVVDLNLFQKFTQLCAARIGQILNLTSLGNECGISDVTARKWLSLLEASYIIFLLYPHHKHFNKRIVKNPKIYFYDTGLACALLKISYDLLLTHPIKGSLFECFVIAEIVKHYHNKGLPPPIYFWRDHTGHEIDCVIDRGVVLTPVEVKSNMTVSSKFFDGLVFWQQLTGMEPGTGFVVYAGKETQKRAPGTVVGWKDISMLCG